LGYLGFYKIVCDVGGDGFGDDATDLISIGQRTLGTQSEYSAVYIGYLAVWLMFCVMGVGVQWELRLLEVLNGHMVIANPLISAAV